MTKAKLILMFLLVLAGVSNLRAQSSWQEYYEDERAEILYKYVECADHSNSLYFNYYLIKIINKTDGQIRVEYNVGGGNNDPSSINEEGFKNLVLKPLETLNGKCDSSISSLRLFVGERGKSGSSEKKPFMISKIATYEL